MPLVTVGIAAYNAADTIERCIRSAQDQDWKDIEIVVVDDASIDDTVSRVERIASSDSRVRLVRFMTNQGVAAVRNALLHEARGDYLAFLDDDDEAMPDRISVQMASLRSKEAEGMQLIAGFGSRIIVGPDGEETYARATGWDGAPVTGENAILSILTGVRSREHKIGRHGTGTLMASTATLRSVGDFDPFFRRHEDADWVVRLLMAGGAIVGSAEPVIRQYVTQSADKSADVILRLGIALRRKHRTCLKKYHAYWAAIARCYVEHFTANGPRWKFRIAVAVLFLLKPSAVLPQWIDAKRAALRKRAAV
jgi:glycosyltransferase involved in cell wall biosynthesis